MDIKHNYIGKGVGDPLILLHGNGENCEYFKGQIDKGQGSIHGTACIHKRSSDLKRKAKD